jgi:5-oxoprolinase (ATP-hydrolysing) subunit A
LNLNSDLGEGAGHDEEILARIDSANVCCGAHAGSPELTAATVRRCLELGVEVGAHPGYPDRENFGRLEMGLTAAEIETLIREQCALVAATGAFSYIKAHGALYFRCQDDEAAAEALGRVADELGVGVMGQPGFAILEVGRRRGLPVYREGYADRDYLPDGRLAPRSRPGAVLSTEQAVDQGLGLARSGDFDTICLHGDSPGAAETARRLREALSRAGIETGPLRSPG